MASPYSGGISGFRAAARTVFARAWEGILDRWLARFGWWKPLMCWTRNDVRALFRLDSPTMEITMSPQRTPTIKEMTILAEHKPVPRGATSREMSLHDWWVA
mmetsp:Transcript_79841/g.140910  ORF Transcript_79841/g.140910 Transcript_79841/m.140910 type:complete len:102 (+) Transcript_79841:1963-2268(+)